MVFEFEDEHGRWVRYDAPTEAAVLGALASGDGAVGFAAGRQRYELGLRLVQTNQASGVQRPVRISTTHRAAAAWPQQQQPPPPPQQLEWQDEHDIWTSYPRATNAELLRAYATDPTRAVTFRATKKYKPAHTHTWELDWSRMQQRNTSTRVARPVRWQRQAPSPALSPLSPQPLAFEFEFENEHGCWMRYDAATEAAVLGALASGDGAVGFAVGRQRYELGLRLAQTNQASGVQRPVRVLLQAPPVPPRAPQAPQAPQAPLAPPARQQQPARQQPHHHAPQAQPPQPAGQQHRNHEEQQRRRRQHRHRHRQAAAAAAAPVPVPALAALAAAPAAPPPPVPGGPGFDDPVGDDEDF